MKRIYLFPVFLLLSVFVYGCYIDADENQVDFDLMGSEKTLPPDSDIPYVDKIRAQSEFEETWMMYGFESKIPNVNFDEKDVYFIGVRESGSCPYSINKIKTSKDRENLIVSLSSSDGDCTTDAVPKTFVIQIGKNISEQIENVKVMRK